MTAAASSDSPPDLTASRVDAVRVVARMRWAGVVLGVVQAFLVTTPRIGGWVAMLIPAFVMAAYNVPMTVMPGRRPGSVDLLARAGLVGDFAVLATWVLLVSNDVHSTAYVIFILLGIEAAFLFGGTGTIAVAAGFVVVEAVSYWVRAAFFGIPTVAGSITYRLGISVAAMLFCGALADQSERRRRAAVAARDEAHRQAEIARHRADELRTSLQLIEAARDDAERATRAKSAYLSRISHELRTPLTAILGFADLLTMDNPRDDQRAAIEAVSSSGAHLRALIDDVLDISRIEQGRHDLPREVVALGPVLADALTLLSASANEKSVTVRSRFVEVEPETATVVADDRSLRQVVVNLVSNAIKYNADHGTVEITVGPVANGARLAIAVRDTGPGIPGDRVSSIFEPFERLGASRLGIEGSGLGLTLVRELVTAMGGTISVESKDGDGATFTVELDRGAAAGVAPAPSEAAAGSDGASSR